MKTPTQTLLDGNIDRDVISTREQAGTTLSYLETWYVIDRLNQVLGQGNWGYQVGTLTKVFEGTVKQKSGDVFAASYTSTVYLNARVDGNPIVFSEVGYGSGTNKYNPGDAHEMATKGAVSDGLKRAAKNLGRSMGLALYDKSQEYVGKVQTKDVAGPDNSKSSGTSAASAGNQQSNIPDSTKIDTKTKDEPQEKPTVIKEAAVKDLITSAFKVLEAQNKISKDAFKMNYLGGNGLSTIAPTDLPGIYTKMKTDFPQLTNGKGE